MVVLGGWAFSYERGTPVREASLPCTILNPHNSLWSSFSRSIARERCRHLQSYLAHKKPPPLALCSSMYMWP